MRIMGKADWLISGADSSICPLHAANKLQSNLLRKEI